MAYFSQEELYQKKIVVPELFPLDSSNYQKYQGNNYINEQKM